MKSKLSLVLVLVAPFAHAQSPLALAKKMAAEYQATVVKMDFDRLGKALTKDFVYIDAKGNRTTKAQAVAGMKRFYTGMSFQTFKVTAVSAKMAQGGLLYVQDTKLVGVSTMGGPKAMFFNSDARDEVLVVKQGGKWLTKRVKSLKSVDTVNGKKM